jgi:hypothetical protein
MSVDNSFSALGSKDLGRRVSGIDRAVRDENIDPACQGSRTVPKF